MNNKKKFFFIILILLTSLVGIYLYKSYSDNKIQSKKEARFDHFMNYWYSFLNQYTSDVEIYTRMKKSVILDYIKNHDGRYIYEYVPLYGGGSFSMRKYCNIEEHLDGWWIAHRAVGPINTAPNSRLKERMAFYNIYRCGKQLSKIDDYDEKMGYDSYYLESIFNKIDSLSYEIHRNFILLDRYKTTHVRNADLNTLNSISDSEYMLDYD